MFVRGSYWVVRDQLQTAGAHRYEIRFHFAAGAPVSLEDREGTTVVVEPSLQVATFGPGEWHLSTGYVSPRYGAREPAPVAGFAGHGEGPQHFVTFLIPERAATVRELPTTGGPRLRIRNGTTRELFVLGDRGSVETGDGPVPTTQHGWGRRACAG